MFYMQKIGNFIASKRKEKGLTQGQLAERLGVTHQAVSKWERGETLPETSKINDLAEAINVKANDILNPAYVNDEANAEQKEADCKYYKLANRTAVGSIFPLAPHMSRSALKDALKYLYNEAGSFTASLLLPYIDAEDVDRFVYDLYRENGYDNLVDLMKFVSVEIIDSIIVEEYSKNNIGVLFLFKYSQNLLIADAIFEAEVRKHGTWNSLRPYITFFPGDIVVKHGISYAVKNTLASFNHWFSIIGRVSFAKIMIGYADYFNNSPDSWRQIDYFKNHADSDILEEARNKAFGVSYGKDDNFNKVFEKFKSPAVFANDREDISEEIENLQDELEDLREEFDELECEVDELEARKEELEEIIKNLENTTKD